MNHQFEPKTILSHPSEPPHSLTTILPPTNHNSATTPRQSEVSQTTPHTPKPYDNVLGLDGKLKPEELECRHKNKLCLVCGSSNHHIRKRCPELLEAQGAMRASRPYREAIVSASAR